MENGNNRKSPSENKNICKSSNNIRSREESPGSNQSLHSPKRKQLDSNMHYQMSLCLDRSQKVNQKMSIKRKNDILILKKKIK